MKVVEVRFDLKNPNAKPKVDYFDVTKETETHYYASSNSQFDYSKGRYAGRRFLKGTLNESLYGGMLNYYYRFTTESTDYIEIEHSEQMHKAMVKLQQITVRDLKCYSDRLNAIYDYHMRNDRDGEPHA